MRTLVIIRFIGGNTMDLTIKQILKTILSGFIVLWVLTANLQAFQAYTHTELTDKVDELFKEWDRIDSPGAAVGIFKDGRIIYARGYGIANLEYNIPIIPQSVFRVGSVSKQFTAMCIAILAEKGKISLDDDIRKYLPEMPEFDPPVTIRHMVHHTSGIRGYLILQGLAGRSGGYFYTSQDIIDLLSRQRELNFRPGDEYSYSNSGYFLLAVIVGRASGMETSEFAKKYIFEPLGMNSTHFHDDPKMIVKNRASGYLLKMDGGFKIHMTELDMIGDGGIFTTIEDFFKWDQNFCDNKLGNGTQDLIDLVLTPGKLNDGREIDYAFGLVIDKYKGLRTISHGGSFVGFRSYYMQFPDQKFSVVIHANLGSFNPGRIARSIADLYLADQFTAAPVSRQQRPQQKRPEPIALSTRELEEFVGEYYSDELDATAILEMENNNLVLKLGRHKSNLTPISSKGFLTTYLNDDAYSLSTRRLDFKRDRKRKITGFVIQAGRIQNLRFEMKK